MALTEAVSGFGPLTVTVDRVETSSSAVEARFAPTPELLRLGEVVREALQQVYGPDIRVHPGGRPHMALAYGHRAADTPDLCVPYEGVVEECAGLWLLDHDTFPPGFGRAWPLDSLRLIGFGEAAQAVESTTPDA